MSGDTGMMLATVTKVLERQAPMLRSTEEKDAFARGLQIWKEYYSLPASPYKYSSLKKFIKSNVPAFVLRTAARGHSVIWPRGGTSAPRRGE